MDLEPVQADLKSRRFLTAEYLSKNRDKIKRLWELKATEKNLATVGNSFPVIGSSLGIFLDELAAMLLQNNPIPEKLSENAMSKIYGGERAIVEGYSLSRLLWDFGLVRETLIAELQQGMSLNPDVHCLIDRTIDVAMSLAATEFERVHNARLQEILAKAESSNRDLEEFAMVAAHDLNSPLATVTNLLELLRECIPATSPAEAAEYITYMEQTLTRMRSLVNSLLGYARLNKSTANFQKVLLVEALQAALQNLAHLIEQSETKIKYGSLPEVTGDFHLLSLVFQNLISNSIKYRGTLPPEIEISVLDTSSKNWLLSVRDNGVGFESKDQDEIFKLYKRLKNNSSPPGAGIGLATCRKIIALHGGRIWAESQPGLGSTFFVMLPRNPIFESKDRKIS